MEADTIIAIGSKGTSIPGKSHLVRGPLQFGTNTARWAGQGAYHEADKAHGWVSRNGQSFELVLLSEAIRSGKVKAFTGIQWVSNGVRHTGTAYVKPDWQPSDPQPQYVAVESSTWSHGRVEGKRINDGRNRDVLGILDFSSCKPPSPARCPGAEAALLGEFYEEGNVRLVVGNHLERNRAARQKCIDLKGTTCIVCRFNFADVYGPQGAGFIHVHHEKPLGEGVRSTDPVRDLSPVCPNCHAMLHLVSPPLKIAELQAMIHSSAQGRS